MQDHTRKTFWSSDWFTGVVFTLAFVLLAFGLARGFFYSLETAVYDRGLALKNVTPGNQVTVVAIDDESIDKFGRWPWSRDVLAAAVDQLNAGGAKVIVSTIFLSEPQIDAGVDYLRDLQEFVAGATGRDEAAQQAAADSDAPADDAAPAGEAAPLPQPALDSVALQRKIADAINSVDYDRRLAGSIAAAGNVALPMQFAGAGVPAGRPDAPLPDYITRMSLGPSLDSDAIPFRSVSLPIELFGAAAATVGHANRVLDVDGAVRSEALLVDYYGTLYPSLALVTAARALNLDLADIEVSPGHIGLGNLDIETDRSYTMLNHFYARQDGRAPFSVDPFYDVITGRVPTDKFNNRIVLLGATATGIGDSLVTPTASAAAPVMVLAHTVASLLNANFVTRPEWTGRAEALTLLALALYIVLALPRLNAGPAALISLGLGVALLAGELHFLANRSVWLQLIAPFTFLLCGHLVMTIKRFGVTERLKSRSEEAGAESNRMLGLAFQGQGQLDMAFEKLRQCPLNDSLMEPLYNLALDYERKRQFSKAGAVYSLMAEHNPNYRDLSVRLRRSHALEETLILGGGNMPAGASLVLGDDSVEKPMLGRYVVEKEIGKGAMGTVYLGRDPKINRVVAIKTIALSREFDEQEINDARDRFFREAETAGRLNHPDIVTVYDAGEEHDLAYIAMEFLKGQHLSGLTRSNNLLPVDTVISLAARAADALGYAHNEDVVHRDIKPANIMYDPQTGDMKITDFGIARITSSSKTKTGIVLGTPSYMSPEQLAGKNVTGRSDLFSLGVTLYQLLTGQLPFRADSMATLMYKIANEPHTPLRMARPELPPCLETVIDRALCKNADSRYQSGAEFALDLRDCIAYLAA